MKNKKDSIGAKNAESQESSTLLDPKKELQLVKQAQQGDVFARNVLITSNMGIIRTFALKYHSAMEYSDALQEATIGFMKAIDKELLRRPRRLLFFRRTLLKKTKK